MTGLVPVEYPTTRRLGASPEAHARGLNAAFADPEMRAAGRLANMQLTHRH